MLKHSSTLPKLNLNTDQSEWLDMTETDDDDDERSISSDTHGDGHLPNNNFSCQQCPFKTTNKSELKSHARKWHFLRCKDCRYSTTSAGCLANHQERHKRADMYRCNLCTFSCGNESAIYKHVNHCHSNKPKSTKKPAELFYIDQHFKCDHDTRPCQAVIQSSTIAPPVSLLDLFL